MIIATTAYVVSIEFDIMNFFNKTSITTSTFVVNVTFVVIDFLLKTKLFNDIIVYDFSKIVVKLIVVANFFIIIWNDQNIIVNISKKQWMLIDLKLNVNIKSTKIYSIELKKRKVIDDTFDKMHVNDKMTWSTQFTVFNFSIFVVWRDIFNDFKSKIIVDIKDLNKMIEIDIYFMSLQTNIISVVIDYNYIFTIDVVNWFHQFNVRRRNRSKFIVISHKKQKQSNVALMKFKNSSLYVQRQTNQMLQSHRKFSRAYMNDIIIFFKTLNEHVKHFRQIFRLFQKRRVNLTSIKFYLNYSFIILLKQKIDNLKLFIIVEKITVIISLQFSISLRKLKYFLKLTNWLRHCIERFVQLTQSLQVKKTSMIKQLTTNVEINDNKNFDSIKKKQFSKLIFEKITNEKKKSFFRLQEIFFNLIFLIHFDSNRNLYIDLNAFKRWKFAVMIYYVVDNSKNDNFSHIVVQSILFFNKLFNDVEKNYWFTKLKIVEIVWMIKHVRYMIDFIKRSFIIIYIDHSTVMSIFKQTSLTTFNTNKLNLHLIRASQYFSSFNIVIRHKTNKIVEFIEVVINVK